MLWRQNKNSEAIDLLKKFVYQQKNPTAKLNCTLVAVKLLLMQVKCLLINHGFKLINVHFLISHHNSKFLLYFTISG